VARLQSFDQAGLHRLIPSLYTKESVLENLPLAADVLADLSEIDAATNERKAAEHGEKAAIGPSELLFGVPYARFVNAAFCHPGPFGGRFSSPQRGAWYAAVEVETSIAEVAFHRRRFLAEARIPDQLTFSYLDFLADFHGTYHYLETKEMQTCLRPDPVPECYQVSQALANRLLYEGSNGIVYPSVRRPPGASIACFRPALVFNPRKGREYQITLQAQSDFISTASSTTETLR
jgi:RES domain-containing protein